jgi:hypothetical protein
MLGLRRAGDMRDDLAADDCQADRRAEPCGVPDELTAAHRLRIAGHGFTTTVPRMNGWMEQM